MVGGASKLRRAARKIRLPFGCSCTCGGAASFSPTQQQVNTNFSRSSVVFTNPQNVVSVVTEEAPESTTTTNTTAKSLCAICLEPLSLSCSSSSTRASTASPSQAIFTAQCSHSFHFTCISSNVRHGSVTCPICRAHWTQLPRPDFFNLPSSMLPCNQTADPILRILDDSIATFRVHRRSSLRSTRYDDDDPINPPPHCTLNQQNRLHFTLVPAPLAYCPSFPHACVCLHPASYHRSHHHPPCGLSTLHDHFTGSSSSSRTSPHNDVNKQKNLCTPTDNNGAYCLSVKLAQQQATDLVLVASPNGPHLRLLKQSMALVVFSLRSIDRLAIVVTYSSSATRAFPLRRMTCHGKRTALQVIDRLFYMGDADPGPGLNKGMKILEDRAHQNPQSSILHLYDTPIPTTSYNNEISADSQTQIHQFHMGFDYGTSGFVMHEFEEFLARLLGGVIRDTQLRINGEVVRLGELRGGEERRIPLLHFNLQYSECIPVTYSYIEGGEDEYLRTGEVEVSLAVDASQSYDVDKCVEEAGGRDTIGIAGRTSSVQNWDYHDPYMARRWAKRLHGYR